MEILVILHYIVLPADCTVRQIEIPVGTLPYIFHLRIRIAEPVHFDRILHPGSGSHLRLLFCNKVDKFPQVRLFFS